MLPSRVPQGCRSLSNHALLQGSLERPHPAGGPGLHQYTSSSLRLGQEQVTGHLISTTRLHSTLVYKYSGLNKQTNKHHTQSLSQSVDQPPEHFSTETLRAASAWWETRAPPGKPQVDCGSNGYQFSLALAWPRRRSRFRHLLFTLRACGRLIGLVYNSLLINIIGNSGQGFVQYL